MSKLGLEYIGCELGKSDPNLHLSVEAIGNQSCCKLMSFSYWIHVVLAEFQIPRQRSICPSNLQIWHRTLQLGSKVTINILFSQSFVYLETLF